jgi:asparagine synthase (glutamine-hydrolysing)
MPHLDVRYVDERWGPLDNLEQQFLRTGGAAASDRVTTLPLIAAAAGAGARVLMDGHGGDYTLNPRVNGWLAAQLRRGRLATVLSELRAYRRNGDVPIARIVKSHLLFPLLPRVLQRWWQTLRGMAPPRAGEVLNPDFAQQVTEKIKHLEPISADRNSPMSFALDVMQESVAPALSIQAAAYGMEFTQPFHDKRVVELALAIPESLYVRNGRQRYLARTALADVLPPAFLTRPDGNISRSPDFADIAARAGPQLLAEIERMEKKETLARYFDFPRIRAMLTGADKARLPRFAEMRKRQAIRAIILARFVEWNNRSNRP